MNYKELEKANGLLNEIKNIDRMIEDIVDYNYVEIVTKRTGKSFGEKYKQKFINVLKEIKEEIIKELKELGVTEV
jgi:hypothetical protein